LTAENEEMNFVVADRIVVHQKMIEKEEEEEKDEREGTQFPLNIFGFCHFGSFDLMAAFVAGAAAAIRLQIGE
jgi:hypothetical protein